MVKQHTQITYPRLTIHFSPPFPFIFLKQNFLIGRSAENMSDKPAKFSKFANLINHRY